jgi:AcrR family transcriptional regulator
MGRWEPDARGRLAAAAMELYVERGFDQTTVAQIAERAGLTERTFFRHYADKREVLFAGTGEFQSIFLDAIAAAPAGASPMDAVAAALTAAGQMFAGLRDGARVRQGVIDAHPELRERELIKMATLATSIAEALRARGVVEPAASLAAEAGVAVFRVAFERWLVEDAEPSLARVLDDMLAELRTVTAA